MNAPRQWAKRVPTVTVEGRVRILEAVAGLVGIILILLAVAAYDWRLAVGLAGVALLLLTIDLDIPRRRP